LPPVVDKIVRKHFRQSLLTTASEFLSRGLLWLRVLALGAFMPLDAYGLVLLYLGIEGLLAATASYPFIKDVLVRQDLKPVLYLRFAVVFAVIGFPAALVMMTVGNLSASVAVILVASAFLNGLSQIGIYVLRVADVRAHNRAKIIWSVLTTLMFLALLPLSWLWLPVVYLAGVLVLMVAASHAVSKSKVGSAQEANLAHHLRGWLIYGSQAVMLSLPQHGMRLVVAATMTLADVARFTQVYMLATASFFVYSAIMIAVEADLSRAAPPLQIRSRFRKAWSVSALLCLVAVLHYGALLFLADLEITDVFLGLSLASNSELLGLLIIFTALSGLRVVANALALAASGRSFSLLATIAGALTLGIGLFALIPTLGLAGIALALILGQAVEVTFLVGFVVKKTRAEDPITRS
jgi:O-antigen/teichoic acid export membrane protein